MPNITLVYMKATIIMKILRCFSLIMNYDSVLVYKIIAFAKDFNATIKS